VFELHKGVSSMSKNRLHLLAAVCLVVGSILGLVGSFTPTAVRGIVWGLDGTLLVIGAALLAVHHLKRGHEQLVAGFIVFVAGQTLVVSCSAMALTASSPVFAAGAGLWAAALALISASSLVPAFVRVTGFIASLGSAVAALQIYGGAGLTPLSKPLPTFVYPFLVLTLFGWAWNHYRSDENA
jgi:hypothetical protein